MLYYRCITTSWHL